MWVRLLPPLPIRIIRTIVFVKDMTWYDKYQVFIYKGGFMSESFVYLTYYQAMAFMIRIDEMKKNNTHFSDEIIEFYEEYVVKRTGEIVTTYPQIRLIVFPNASKYKISKSLFDYLTRITSIDVCDKETIKKYKMLTKEFEKTTFERIKENLGGMEFIIQNRG